MVKKESDKFGEAISLASSEDEKQHIYEKYIQGKPEEIVSKLAVQPVLRTSILSLISSGFVRKEDSLFEFFKSSFYGHQYKDDWGFRVKIEDVTELLLNYGFIRRIGEKLEPTKLGKRVSELYIDPETAYWIIKGLENYSRDSPEFALLHLICNTAEMSPLLRIGKSDYEWIDAEVAEREHQLLFPIPKEWDIGYESFLNAFKTALLLQDWIDEKSEEQILDRFNVRPGELHVKRSNAEWLMYAVSELARLLKMQEKLSNINKARLRVKHGIRVELIPLVKLKGVGRYRARKLYRAGIKNLADLRKAPLEQVAGLIGEGIARNIKEQVIK